MKTLSSNQQKKAVLLLLWTKLPTFERQLSDDRFYNKSDKDPTKQFSDEITNELNNMYDYGYIDEQTLKYLIPDSPKPGRFYLLPKIHKPDNPGRPIASANGHPTEKNLRICGCPPSPTCWSSSIFYQRYHWILTKNGSSESFTIQHYSGHYEWHPPLHQYSPFWWHRSL